MGKQYTGKPRNDICHFTGHKGVSAPFICL